MAKQTFDISLERLLESGAHFGHQYRRWNPKMEPYLYAVKEGIYVFDLIKTKDCLEQALEVLSKAAKSGQTILLVGTKKQAKDRVKEVAEVCGCPYVNERWLGGTLTNFDQIKGSMAILQDLEETLKTAKGLGFTKKERLLMQRKIDRMRKNFGGIINLTKKPDLMFIVDIRHEKGAVTEATAEGVETIGIVDSNADPTLVDWPIPLNDDAAKTIDYILELVQEAITGKKPKSTGKKVTKNDKKDKSQDK